MTELPSAAVSVCPHCLADRQRTAAADHLPDDQRCPGCGSAYNGPPRTAAYQALVAAGLAQPDNRGDNGAPKVVLGLA